MTTIATSPLTFYQQVDAFEKRLLTEAREHAYGDIEEAARGLGISPLALELKIERLSIERRKLRAPGPRAEW